MYFSIISHSSDWRHSPFPHWPHCPTCQSFSSVRQLCTSEFSLLHSFCSTSSIQQCLCTSPSQSVHCTNRHTHGRTNRDIQFATASAPNCTSERPPSFSGSCCSTPSVRRSQVHPFLSGAAMSPRNVSLVLFLFLLAVLIPIALSIKCWECNTRINGGCGDPFVPGDFAQADCSQKHLPRFPDKNGHFCRKTTQKINNVVRVIRTCGYINETMDQVPEGAVLPKTCEKQSGAVVIETCVCNSGDGCNSVGSLTGGPLTYLLPLAVGALTLALRAR